MCAMCPLSYTHTHTHPYTHTFKSALHAQKSRLQKTTGKRQHCKWLQGGGGGWPGTAVGTKNV